MKNLLGDIIFMTYQKLNPISKDEVEDNTDRLTKEMHCVDLSIV